MLIRHSHIFNLHKPEQAPKPKASIRQLSEPIKSEYKIGDKISVFKTVYDKWGCVGCKKKTQGIIHGVYDRFVVVDFGKYRECYFKDELEC